MTPRRWLLALLTVTLVLPLVLPAAWLTVYVFIGLDTVVVAGLSLLMGFAGQVSLGQAAFYAVGAYTALTPGVAGSRSAACQ